MSKFIGGPCDGTEAMHLATKGSTFLGYIELSGRGIVTHRAPYRYRATEDGKDWEFESYGTPVIEHVPRITSIEYGALDPVWTVAKPA